jgi:hypothetical protein
MIVEALEADLNQGEHPLLEPRSARKVLIQGVGRAVTGVPRLRRVLHSLVSRPANADTMNALAMILARREEAPRALTRMRYLQQRVCLGIAKLNRVRFSLDETRWLRGFATISKRQKSS